MAIWGTDDRRKIQAEVALRSGEVQKAFEAYLGKNPSSREIGTSCRRKEERKEEENGGNNESEEGPTTDRNKKQAVRSEVRVYSGHHRIEKGGVDYNGYISPILQHM